MQYGPEIVTEFRLDADIAPIIGVLMNLFVGLKVTATLMRP